MIGAVLCDLDDTLYDEFDYVKSGMWIVAQHMASTYGGGADSLYELMINDILLNGRGTAFDVALSHLRVDNPSQKVGGFMQIYRNHKPDISLPIETLEFLSRIVAISPPVRLGLVTDGLPTMQKNKVISLGLEKVFHEIVYCWEIGKPKPSPSGLALAANRLGVPSHECIVIGDSIEKDILPALSLGMMAFRVHGRSKNLSLHECEGRDYRSGSLLDFFNDAGGPEHFGV
jgi:putative hydrolase of the HAD superfamily